MSDEVQTASQGCHRSAAAFYYKPKSRGEQDTYDTHTQMLNFYYKSKSRGEQDTKDWHKQMLNFFTDPNQGVNKIQERQKC